MVVGRARGGGRGRAEKGGCRWWDVVALGRPWVARSECVELRRRLQCSALAATWLTGGEAETSRTSVTMWLGTTVNLCAERMTRFA